MSAPVDAVVMPMEAGSYSDEDAYNCDTDKYDKRKIRVACPKCGNESSPCAALRQGRRIPVGVGLGAITRNHTHGSRQLVVSANQPIGLERIRLSRHNNVFPVTPLALEWQEMPAGQVSRGTTCPYAAITLRPAWT